VSRTAELLRRVGAQSNAAVQFALDGLDDDGFAFSPAPDVPSVAWRIRHITAVVRLYIDHGFGSGGPTFGDYVASLDALDRVGVLAELAHAQGNFVATLDGLRDDDLDQPRRSHWGGELPAWQVVWTVVVEQFHHGAEIGALLDARRGAPRPHAMFPELQDGRTLT
jgi:uncharacterized damage-inducible protein DinB